MPYAITARYTGLYRPVANVTAAADRSADLHCFMSDKRLTCRDLRCELRRECCRLVAVWKR